VNIGEEVELRGKRKDLLPAGTIGFFILVSVVMVVGMIMAMVRVRF
jgi:hypothetical protein